jgi:hypothetical protein
MPHLSVTLMIEDWADRPIDGKLLANEWPNYHKRILNKYLLPVHAQTGDLGVKIRKVTTLKQGIIAEANSGDNVGSTKRDLLYFWEKFVRGTIQN